MTLRRLEIFIIVVVIALIGIIYAFTQRPVLAPTSEQIQTQQVSSNVIEYRGVDGRSALDLLKESNAVEVKSYSFGDMVVGINGVSPDATHFWSMYVNGEMSQVGAAQYITKSTDMIKWQLDEVNN